jgi:citrate lyase synthetase
LEVIEIERKSIGSDVEGNPNYISAGKIRQAIIEDDLTSIQDFLPPCTIAYLQSPSSKAVWIKLKR